MSALMGKHIYSKYVKLNICKIKSNTKYRKNALALLDWTQDLFGIDAKKRNRLPPASFVAQQVKSNLNHDS